MNLTIFTSDYATVLEDVQNYSLYEYPNQLILESNHLINIKRIVVSFTPNNVELKIVNIYSNMIDSEVIKNYKDDTELMSLYDDVMRLV